jgi:Fe-S oxidoreductase
MWVDIPGPRLSETRVKDAVEAGADILATACPYCLLTFEDAVKTTGNEGKIQIMDIAELLVQAL